MGVCEQTMCLYMQQEWVWPYKLCGELHEQMWLLYMWPEWAWPYKLCGELYMWSEGVWLYKLCWELVCDLMSVIIQACVGSLYMWSEGVWLYELCLYMWPEWVWPYKLCGELYRSNMNKCDCRSLYIWPEWVWPYKLCGEIVHVIWRSAAVRAIFESLYMWSEWVWPYKLCGELYTSNMNRNLYMWPEWAWPYKLCGELIYTCDLKECGCTSYVWELVYVTWMSVVIQAMWGACTVFGRSVLPYVGSFCTWSEWTYKLCLGACAFYDLLQSIVGHVFVALCVIF